jgi:putative transposase
MPTLRGILLPTMSEYRRMFAPGAQFFLTLVTERRRPLFGETRNVDRLRHVVARVRAARPFELLGAVILPDHIHWLIELPPGDADFSARIGSIKAGFTKTLPAGERPDAAITPSRSRRREQMIWQRRFWEHTIRDERDLEAHMDYIHYNPVKHGHARCPHAWPYSSLHRWVRAGRYPDDWACVCTGRPPPALSFDEIAVSAGE